MGVVCGVSGAGGHSGRERSEPGRLRHFVAPLHLVLYSCNTTIARAKLSTGYPQLIATNCCIKYQYIVISYLEIERSLIVTKEEFKNRVKSGFFSCEWTKNNGQVAKVKRGILGTNAFRFTNEQTRESIREHNDYVLAFRVGNGLLPQHRRWVNINPLTVTKINGVEV